MKAQMSESALLGAAKSVLNGVRSSSVVVGNGGSSATSSVAVVAAAAAAAAMNGGNCNGRVTKRSSGRDAATTEEMQIYFSKLKQLVPFMPRHRKLSKLEIIQYVIDYICDLQLALEETHPSVMTSSAALSATASHRQPLADVVVNVVGGGTSPINSPQPPMSTAMVTSTTAVVAGGGSSSSPTTPTSVSTCAAQEANKLDQLPCRLIDDLNTRPVSC